MNANFELNSMAPDRQLVVETREHVVAANLQQTKIIVRDAQHPSQTYNLTQEERKALAAFLLSIPDDQP